MHAKVLKTLLLIQIIFLTACSTLVSISPKQIEQLPQLEIVRVSTPPLIRNTWTESYVRAFPNATLAQGLYARSTKEKGLLPPDIPDFGEILAKQMLVDFAKKKAWPKTTIANNPVVELSKLTPGNYLIIEIDEMRISGLGHLYAMLRVKLQDKNGSVLWEKRAGYNGLYSSKGENLDERLLIGKKSVEQEFVLAAKEITENLISSLP